MNKNLKKRLADKKLLKIRYLIACAIGKRDKFIRKNQIFAEFGENVLFQPRLLPNDAKYIKLHNNIQVAAGVTFFNHDVINSVFNNMRIKEGKKGVIATHVECIEVFDNCFIGGNSTILGGGKNRS